MPSVAKYRRTWFALLREAEIPDDDRHWVQEAHTGKASTKDWGPADWQRAIAGLQRDLGQHRDRHAHVREDHETAVAARPGQTATPRQCTTIEQVCDEIEWRAGRERGPFAYLLGSSLKGPTAELRREVLRRAWGEGVRGVGLWSRLWRKEAGDFIRALLKLKRYAPLGVNADE